MVCLPCFIIPAVLFIWYRFLQPIAARFFPFLKVEEAKPGAAGACPGAATGAAKCPIAGLGKKDETEAAGEQTAEAVKEGKQD